MKNIDIQDFNNADHSIIYADLVPGYSSNKKYFSSPLRDDIDKKFSVFIARDGKLIWKDIKTDQKGDALGLYCLIKGIDRKNDLNTALYLINKEYNYGLERTSDFIPIKREYNPIEYSIDGLGYWNQYNVTEDNLKDNSIIQIESDSIGFAFKYPSGNFKKYFPNGKPKYINRSGSSMHDDLQYLNKYKDIKHKNKERLDYLLVCEGCKDAFIARANGLNAVGIQSTSSFPSQSTIIDLKRIAKYLIVCFDNDEPGELKSVEFAHRFNCLEIRLDEKYNDVGDYFKDNSNSDHIQDKVNEVISKHRLEHNILVTETIKGYVAERHFRGSTKDEIISNFIIEQHAFIEGEESQKIIKLVKHNSETESFLCSTDTFVTLDRFKKMSESKGDYFFNGNNTDLYSIKMLTMGTTIKCKFIDHLGYMPKEKTFVLSNGAIKDGLFHETDKFGIFESFYIPSASKDNEFNSAYANVQKIRYKPGKISSNEWIENFISLYTIESGVLAISWVISHLYFDHIYRVKKFFPLLLIWGQKGSGKSSFAKILLYLFGDAQQEVNLSQATAAGLGRSLSQFSNIPQWFNEFKNNIRPNVKEMLKGAYDGAGKLTALKDHSNNTKSIKIRSSTFVTGEEIPSDNEALFSRMVVAQLPVIKASNEAKNDFIRKEKKLSNGLGNILVELLTYREEILLQFEEIHSIIYQDLAQYCIEKNLTANTRLFDNYSTIFAPLWILIKEKKIKLEKIDGLDGQKLKKTLFDLVEKQIKSEASLDVVNEFLEYIPLMIRQSKLTQNINYWFIKHGQDDVIAIGSDVWKLYTKFYFDINKKQSTSPQQLKAYIQEKEYFIYNDRTRVPKNMGGTTQLRVTALNIKYFPGDLREEFDELIKSSSSFDFNQL